MEVKYKIQISSPLTVELTQRQSVWPVGYGQPGNVWAELSETQCREITDYVERLELGHRVAYDMWRLKDQKSLTIFMLHYG